MPKLDEIPREDLLQIKKFLESVIEDMKKVPQTYPRAVVEGGNIALAILVPMALWAIFLHFNPITVTIICGLIMGFLLYQCYVPFMFKGPRVEDLWMPGKRGLHYMAYNWHRMDRKVLNTYLKEYIENEDSPQEELAFEIRDAIESQRKITERNAMMKDLIFYEDEVV